MTRSFSDLFRKLSGSEHAKSDSYTAPKVEAFTDVQTNPTPFEYVLDHLHVIGWPVLCVFAWKISRVFSKVEGRVLAAENHITTMATNHFPHMEESLKNIDKTLQSIDQHLENLR